MLNKILPGTTFAIMLFTPFAVTAAGEPSALEIITSVYERPTGSDQTSDLTMLLTNSSGKSRTRKIRQFSKDLGDSEKKIMFFQSPADVRNTSFMNWSYDEEGKNDDQWIYLPALKKVKRISSDDTGDYFMGSDFTYDDLGDRHPADDTHKMLREEKLDGEECWVIESRPKDPEYMYSRAVTWIIKDKRIGKKKVFYDEDGDELKTLAVVAHEKIKGFWVITHSRMTNTQKGHKTDMRLENIEIETGISSRKFTERMMKRGL